MSKDKITHSALLLFLGVLATIANTPLGVHAQTGTVCIADPTFNPDDCPSSPAIFSGSMGSTFTVAVNIQDSDAFNGFDIRVLADPTVLRPLSGSLTGTVLQNLFVFENSVNATSGVTRVASVAFGFITTSPTTGRLFSIAYQVVGNAGTAIAFPFGCPGSSNDSFCVTIVLASSILPESLQTASFGQPTPDFVMSANPDSVDVPQGSTGNSTITLASLGEFAGTVSLSTSPACLALNCPPWYVAPDSVDLGPDGTGTAILTFSALPETPTSTWVVTVYGQNGSLTHSVDVAFNIVTPPPPPPPPLPPTPDFVLITPISIPMYPGTSTSDRVYLAPQNGFTGNVSLTSNTPQKITTAFNPAIVALASNETVSSSLEVSVAYDISLGEYSLNITGTSGALSHTRTIFITIFEKIVGKVCIAPGDSYSCPDIPPVFTGTVGSQLTVAIDVQGSDGFNAFDIQVSTDPTVLQPVSFSLNGSIFQNPSFIESSINPLTGTVRVGAVRVGPFTTAPTTGRLFSITYNVIGISPGTTIGFPTGSPPECTTGSNNGYCVAILNTNLPGGSALEDLQTASFANPPPDFTITANPLITIVPQGGSSNATITLTSLHGFEGTISLSASISLTGRRIPSFRLTPTTLTLAPDGTATANLIISARSAPLVTYTLTITAIGGGLTRTLTITVIVTSRH